MVGKDHPIASAFPLLLVPAPWAPEAHWDWEVVLQGGAGDPQTFGRECVSDASQTPICLTLNISDTW